jgi:hypothetical protein
VTVSRPAEFDSRVLVIAPHMDDESLGCGLLLATHPRKDQAYVLIVTDGSLSPDAPKADSGAARRLAALREQEVRDALAVLGVPAANIALLGLPDGSLPAMGARLRAVLTSHIQKLAPDSVFVPFRYDRHPDQDYQNYLTGLSQMGASQYVGDVTGYVDGLAEIEVKNRFAVGDRLELIHPTGNIQIELVRMEKVGADGTAQASDVAPGNGHHVRIPLPAGKQGAFLTRLNPE